MSRIFPGTHPKIVAMLHEGYQKMSVAEKLHQVNQLTLAVQQVALAQIRADHPDATDDELRIMLASRWLTKEQLEAVVEARRKRGITG